MAPDVVSKLLKSLSLALICVPLLGSEARAGNFTVVGGLDQTNVSGTSNGDFSSHGVGWYFGGLINLTRYIGAGIETGVLMGERKLTQSTALGLAQPETLNVSATYLELPVEYLWRLSRLFFVDLGVYYLQYVGGSYNAFYSSNASLPAPNSFTMPAADFGALAGFGGEFPISAQKAIRAEARYDAGLLPSNKSKNISLMLGLSVHF